MISGTIIVNSVDSAMIEFSKGSSCIVSEVIFTIPYYLSHKV
uniref:Uncharacterized protein n=1 Tax=Heterorhabditis bacteriophora TaxID=37862 RepID=A0A1I7WIZ1_HETBA